MCKNGVVAFDYAAWKNFAPDHAANVSTRFAQTCFDQACLIFDNSANSLEQDLEKRCVLLYLLTAHIAQIGTNISGSNQPSDLVGRIASATRGSVSVCTENPAEGARAGWFSQTQSGLTFWQMTAKYRQMRVISACPDNQFAHLGTLRSEMVSKTPSEL